MRYSGVSPREARRGTWWHRAPAWGIWPLSADRSPGLHAPVSWCLPRGWLPRRFLCPLLEHAHTALHQQHVRAVAGDHRLTLHNEFVVRMGGQALLHPAPLAQRNDHQPGNRLPARDGGEPFGQRARLLPLHPKGHIGGLGLDGLDIRPTNQCEFHGGCSLRKGGDDRLQRVPGEGLRGWAWGRGGVGPWPCWGAGRGKRRQRSCVVARSRTSWKKTPPGVRRRVPSLVSIPPLASQVSVSARMAVVRSTPNVRRTFMRSILFGSRRTSANVSTFKTSMAIAS